MSAGDRPLEHVGGYTRREVEFIAREEKVERLLDLVLRRTSLALLGRLTVAGLQELSEVLAEALGWSGARRQAEVQLAMDTLHQGHGVQFEVARAGAAV